jgi:uncharacterized protein YbjT (DUF2867 family)
MRNRLITIFGGTGFIGRHVVRRLAAEGARLRVISRDPAVSSGRLQTMGEVGQIAVERIDLRDEAALAAALDGAWAVIDLIGILYETRRQRFAEIQAALPGRIAKVAADVGVARLVLMSAIGADPAAGSAYARSKGEGEAAVRAAMPAATILRPSVVVGPGDGFFDRLAGLARITPVLPLIGGGQTRFQPVHVGDVAAAVVAALQEGAARGATYELGGPQVYTFEELLRYMLEVLERKRLLVPVPFDLARLEAAFLEWLPAPLLTRDQVELLKTDNVVAEGALCLADLGIAATPIEVVVPGYLGRHRARPATPALPRGGALP